MFIIYQQGKGSHQRPFDTREVLASYNDLNTAKAKLKEYWYIEIIEDDGDENDINKYWEEMQYKVDGCVVTGDDQSVCLISDEGDMICMSIIEVKN